MKFRAWLWALGFNLIMDESELWAQCLKVEAWAFQALEKLVHLWGHLHCTTAHLSGTKGHHPGTMGNLHGPMGHQDIMPHIPGTMKNLPNFFQILFCQFFPKLGWEHCFWCQYPIPKVVNWIFHSHSQFQKSGIGFFNPNTYPNFKKIYIRNFIWKQSCLYAPFFITRYQMNIR